MQGFRCWRFRVQSAGFRSDVQDCEGFSLVPRSLVDVKP